MEQLRKLSAQDPEDPLTSLDTSRITLIQETADRATVQIPTPQPPDSKTPEPGIRAELQKIDGKWFPVSVADALREIFRQAHELLEQLKSQNLAQDKQRWFSLFDEIDQATKTANAAKTTDQLNAALVLVQLKLMQLFAPTTPDGKPNSTTPGTDGPHTVVVVIRGPLDDVTRGNLIAQLRTLSGTSGPPEITTSDDATTVILKSKLAPRQFADKIPFGKVAEFSQARSLITIELDDGSPKKKTSPPKKSTTKKTPGQDV